MALLAGCSSTSPEPAASGTASPEPSEPSSSAPPEPSPTPTIDLQADPASIIARPQVPILCYHQIREQTSADSAVDRQYIMPPATFISQMDALKDGGFSTIDPEQLLAYLTTGAELPEKPVMLTYDDSVIDGYTIALPAMQERGFTGTYFLMTVVFGNDRFMSTDQVRELDAAGMPVGVHTWDHHRVDEYAGDDWRTQIEEPTTEIESIVGHPVTTFAYPFGVWGTDAFSHLDDAGLTSAFQLDVEDMDPQRPLMTIRRAIANPQWSTDDLLAKVTDWS